MNQYSTKISPSNTQNLNETQFSMQHFPSASDTSQFSFNEFCLVALTYTKKENVKIIAHCKEKRNTRKRVNFSKYNLTRCYAIIYQKNLMLCCKIKIKQKTEDGKTCIKIRIECKNYHHRHDGLYTRNLRIK